MERLKQKLETKFMKPIKIAKNKLVITTVVALTIIAAGTEYFLNTHPEEYIKYVEASQKYEHLTDKLNLFNYIF